MPPMHCYGRPQLLADEWLQFLFKTPDAATDKISLSSTTGRNHRAWTKNQSRETTLVRTERASMNQTDRRCSGMYFLCSEVSYNPNTSTTASAGTPFGGNCFTTTSCNWSLNSVKQQRWRRSDEDRTFTSWYKPAACVGEIPV
ncbi:hypothetical protein AMECASPLE_037296 [Ameca splendens]|uniref:Uncharacterized protein n=1 Tax=Ameca splendens TaxID=208324 RepID=A0ABV0XL83_9TELE